MKICENKKFNNGKREVYLFGFKLFSYQKKVNHKILNYFKLFYNIKNQTEYIRSLGVKVGENTSFIIHPHFFSYPDFGSEPFLIEIGNNCRISFGCTFLTHDGGLHSIKQAYNIPHGELQKFGKIIIKDGVFIGCKSIIMPGVTIGENSVIGAGSVVTKSIPANEVWAGNPAHFIQTLEQYKLKIMANNNSDNKKDLQ